jgi:hypothetical protein
LAEDVRLEGKRATVALEVQVAEQRSVAPVLVGQSRVVFDSDDAWIIARDRFEKKSRGYVAKVEVEEKGRRRFIVVRTKVDALPRLVHVWMEVFISCWVRWKHRSGARRS